MTGEDKKRKFTSTLTFKILIGVLVLFVLGLFYNFIIAEDETISEQKQQEEQQRNAVLDTVDVIGDYLWPDQKPRKENIVSDESSTKTDDEIKRIVEETKATETKEATENIKNHAAPTAPLPAPAADPVPATTPKTTGKPAAAPSIERISAPKVEKIEQ
jgi:hypothetical protein